MQRAPSQRRPDQWNGEVVEEVAEEGFGRRQWLLDVEAEVEIQIND
jgi:hypothetical protein